jgi:hypothetical protein
MALFNPKESTIMDSCPEYISFIAADSVNNGILPSAHRHARQLRDIGRSKLHLHFNDSTCLIARHVQEQMAGLLVPLQDQSLQSMAE